MQLPEQKDGDVSKILSSEIQATPYVVPTLALASRGLSRLEAPSVEVAPTTLVFEAFPGLPRLEISRLEAPILKPAGRNLFEQNDWGFSKTHQKVKFAT